MYVVLRTRTRERANLLCRRSTEHPRIGRGPLPGFTSPLASRQPLRAGKERARSWGRRGERERDQPRPWGGGRGRREKQAGRVVQRAKSAQCILSYAPCPAPSCLSLLADPHLLGRCCAFFFCLSQSLLPSLRSPPCQSSLIPSFRPFPLPVIISLAFFPPF